MQWHDIHLQPADGAKFGYLQIRGGKSRNAKRSLSLTDRIHALLDSRKHTAKSEWVFTNEAGDGPLSVYTAESQHSKLRTLLKLPVEFVIHGLRHTFLTRLGASNADAFTLMKIAGHSTVAISQRYVHPTPETLEAAYTGPHHKSPVKLKSVVSMCPGGEIGRRKGLKILFTAR